MPRTWDSDLQTIFQAYKRRDKLDIHLNDGTTLKLSRGKVTGYSNWLSSVSDYSSSIDNTVDRISFAAQNISDDLGLTLASNLRKMDYAVAEYVKQYQSLRNPSLVQDITVFRGVMANAEADERSFKAEMVIDYASVGATIASRGLSPRCWWTYKNGVECTSASGETSCPKTREACIKRGVEYQFGGWEFFERPVATPPGTVLTPQLPCFTLDTPIWLPTGEIPIGDLPLGKLREPIEIVSFDPVTGEMNYRDEIVQVMEHEVWGYYTFIYAETRKLNVTPEHNLWRGVGMSEPWRAAAKWSIGDAGRVFNGDRWMGEYLQKIRWNTPLKPVKVRNLTVRRNHTYFANGIAVSNSKGIEEPL